MRLLTGALLDEVSAEARKSPRKRKNRNFHAADASRCNRLLNALEPGTYIRPHRHLDPEKEESMVLVRGRMGLVCFDGAGTVTESAVLEAGSGVFGVDIPVGVYHTAVCLASGTVFFEAKAGPYRPFLPEEVAPWAPEEQDPAVAAYLAGLEAMFRP